MTNVFVGRGIIVLPPEGVDPLGLLPYNVYNLVPSWADNCVILWVWGRDALCAAGRGSRVSVICSSVRSPVCA